MNRSGISRTLLLLPLALLIIYGVDVMVGLFQSTSESVGFLPFNEMIRGIIFGAVPVVLSIIAFFISRKEKSTTTAALLYVNGALIIIGFLIIILLPSRVADGSDKLNNVGTTAILGIIIIGLGIWKTIINRSRNTNA